MRLRTAFLVSALMVIVLGCVKPTAPAEPAAAPATPRAGAPAQQGWEQEWERVKSQARKEGTVVLAGNVGSSANDVIKKTMSEEYGIAPEFMTARGPEVAAKIINEQNAGLYQVDVILSTTTSVLTVLKPQGRVDRMDTALILPEVKDPKLWYRGELPWLDKEKRYHFAFYALPKAGVLVNTQMVNPNELRSYFDLLDPRWKGKILIDDPSISGSGNSWFTPLASELGLEYFAKLLEQEPAVIRDERLMVEWIAKGKYPVLLAYNTDIAADFLKAGAPIAGIQMKEGAYTTQSNGAVSLALKAPHPNAAAVFINWALSKEGGARLSQASLAQSARTDVPTDFLPADGIRRADIKYTDSSTEDYQFKKQEYLKIAQDMFAKYAAK